MLLRWCDPEVVKSRTLPRLLMNCSSIGDVPVCEMRRETAGLSELLATFLAFVREAVVAFDPDETTLGHQARC